MPFTIPVVPQQGVPMTLIDAVTATGVAKSQQFTVAAKASGQDPVLEYQATVVPATALVADFEVSQDGGTTFSKRTVGVDLKTNPVGRLNVNPGVIYRWNITTFTGAGTATLLGTVS